MTRAGKDAVGAAGLAAVALMPAASEKNVGCQLSLLFSSLAIQIGGDQVAAQNGCMYQPKDCLPIETAIDSLVAELDRRYTQLEEDKHGLYDKPNRDNPIGWTWASHQAAYIFDQDKLKFWISQADTPPTCFVSNAAREWAKKPPPDKPKKYQ